jgi:hypothetical protein
MEVARIVQNDREKMGEQPMYRPSQGQAQPQPKSQHAADGARPRRNEDPLAELARLIGQEDPFKEFDPTPRRAPANGNGSSAGVLPRAERRPERLTNGHAGQSPAAQSHAAPRANGREVSVEIPRQTAAAPRAAQPRTAAPAARTPVRAESFTPSRPVRTATSPVSPALTRTAQAQQPHEPFERQPQSRLASRDTAARLPDRTNPRPLRDESPAQSYRQPAQEPAARRGYVPEEAPRTARSRQPAYDYRDRYEDDYDPDYADDAYLADHSDEIYDDVQKPRRGIGFWLIAMIVVLCLIAVGFLGVFAYRTVFNSPPRAAVVTKSSVPTKVEPQKNPVAATPQSNKPIQDRIGGAIDTQVLKREEQPVDLTQPNRQTPAAVPDAARPQQPAVPQIQRNPAFTPPPQQQPQQQAIPQNADQPKRVRTMTVRSDGTVVPNSPSQQNNAPVPLNANPEPDSQTLPPQTRPNSAVPQQNRTVTAALSPSLPPVQQQTTGNYVVQVASHKTPEEAQGAWQNLRQQYASILGTRNADIRKVDLGDRGTFYRAMVGPMGRDQANALCQNLKTQGAGCIVQTR